MAIPVSHIALAPAFFYMPDCGASQDRLVEDGIPLRAPVNHRGVILLSQERIDEGIRELQVLLERDSRHALPKAHLGNADPAREELDQALAVFEGTAPFDPDLAHAHAQKGVVNEEELERLRARTSSGMLYSSLLPTLHDLQRGCCPEMIQLSPAEEGRHE